VLTPVDSYSIYGASVANVERLEGLYATDRPRPLADVLKSKIFFSGRRRMTYDIRSIYAKWSKALGAAETSMRLLSGLHAHVTVFMGVGTVGETVFLLPEAAGGHFATGAILRRLGYRVVDLPINADGHCVDMEGAEALVANRQGGILFIDRSEGLVYEDFSRLTSNPLLYCIFDASQYISGIIMGYYKSPFAMGFDLIISTLHKSFPGPQKALVATRVPDARWERIKQAMSQFVSSHHVRSTYLAGLGLEEDERLNKYTRLQLANAVDFEQALSDQGLPVVRRPQGLPPTQHLWLPFVDNEAAYAACRHLERCRIHTNYRLLPYGLGHGLRLGTTAATMQGMGPENISELANLVAQIIRRGFTLHRRHEVRDLAQKMARLSMDHKND